MMWGIIASLVWIAVQVFWCRSQPLSLDGRKLKIYLACVVLLNIGFSVLLWQEENWANALGWVTASNLLAAVTTTDLHEKMIYELHTYILLGAGVVVAIFGSNGEWLARGIVTFLLFCAFFLISRRESIGMGDGQIMACLALYFPLTRWMEIIILALGSAAIYGLASVIIKKKTWKTQVPFAPFLTAGLYVELLMYQLLR